MKIIGWDLFYTSKSPWYRFDKMLGAESDSHLRAEHILLKFHFFLYPTLQKHGTNTE